MYIHTCFALKMILSSEISSTQLAQELVIDHLIGPLDLQHTERFNESPGRRVIKVPIYSLCFKLFSKYEILTKEVVFKYSAY